MSESIRQSREIEVGRGLTTTGVIALTALLFLSLHLFLTYTGLIPSEVSEFNQAMKEKLQAVQVINYTQPSTDARYSLPTFPSASSTDKKLPTRIVIEKIGVNAPVNNPKSASIPVLDRSLKEGAVRYPGSGGLEGGRQMFLFGHSSRLPVVSNEAYRSFNGLDKLRVGDSIQITGTSSTQNFIVSSVKVVDKDEALISFADNTGGLTLSTCSTFGAKENRVVVEARRAND